MVKNISFTIYGTIRGQERPLAFRMGDKGIRFTDRQNSITYKGLVQDMCMKALKKHGYRLDEFPIRDITRLIVDIECYYSIPKSTSKKKASKMLSQEIYPTKKPDADNIAKIIMDSLNKFIYPDDANVTSLIVNKYYTDKQERVEVKVLIYTGGDE